MKAQIHLIVWFYIFPSFRFIEMNMKKKAKHAQNELKNTRKQPDGLDQINNDAVIIIYKIKYYFIWRNESEMKPHILY